MKTLELNNYGIQKMNTREMRETNGGVFWVPAALVVIGTVLNDWADFKQGLVKGLSAN